MAPHRPKAPDLCESAPDVVAECISRPGCYGWVLARSSARTAHRLVIGLGWLLRWLFTSAFRLCQLVLVGQDAMIA